MPALCYKVHNTWSHRFLAFAPPRKKKAARNHQIPQCCNHNEGGSYPKHPQRQKEEQHLSSQTRLWLYYKAANFHKTIPTQSKRNTTIPAVFNTSAAVTSAPQIVPACPCQCMSDHFLRSQRWVWVWEGQTQVKPDSRPVSGKIKRKKKIVGLRQMKRSSWRYNLRCDVNSYH